MAGDPTKLNGFVRMVVYILNWFVELSQGDVVAVLGLHTLKNRLGITKDNKFSICFWWHFYMRKSAHNSFGFSSKNTWVITDAIRESTQSNALRRGIKGVIQLISKTAKGCNFILSRAISIIMEIVLKEAPQNFFKPMPSPLTLKLPTYFTPYLYRPGSPGTPLHFFGCQIFIFQAICIK